MCAGLLFLFGFVQGFSQDSLWHKYRNHALTDSARLHALDDIIWEMLFSQPDSGLLLSRAQLKEADSLNLGYWKGFAHKNMGRYFMERAKMDSGRFHLRAATKEFENIDAKKALGSTLSELSRIDLMESRYASADSFLQLSYEVHLADSDRQSAGRVRLTQATVARARGDDFDALEKVHAGLLIFEEIGDTMMIGAANRTLGTIFLDQLDIDNAIDAFAKSAEYFAQTNAKLDWAVSTLNLGETWMNKGEYDKALGYLKDAHTVFEEKNFPRYIAISHFILGNCYLLLNQLEKAEENSKKAVEMLQGTQQVRALGYSLAILGTVYLKTNRTNQAIRECLKSEQILRGQESQEEKLKCYECLHQAYEKQGNFAKAFEYLQLKVAAQDSNLNEEKVRAITRLEEKLKFERRSYSDSLTQALVLFDKEAEISRQRTMSRIGFGGAAVFLGIVIGAIFVIRQNRRKNRELAAKNEKIEEQRQVLAAQNEEKGLLLREIHHRVKNNLQIVSSLLDLQINRLGDETAAGAVAEGQARVKSIALIHEKLYRTEDLREIEFGEYARQLVEELVKNFGKGQHVNTDLQSDNIPIDIDTAVPLGLILNELVVNSFKHAFPDQEGAEIVLRLSRKGDREIEFYYADNGPGLPEAVLKGKSTTLGMRLIHGLVRQLKGQLAVSNDGGAVFVITLERKNYE